MDRPPYRFPWNAAYPPRRPEVAAWVDPQNLILEFNEDDNISSRFFGSNTFCQ
jgi:subtilase family serine protease